MGAIISVGDETKFFKTATEFRTFQKQIVLLNYCWNEMYDYENNILQELYL